MTLILTFSLREKELLFTRYGVCKEFPLPEGEDQSLVCQALSAAMNHEKHQGAAVYKPPSIGARASGLCGPRASRLRVINLFDKRDACRPHSRDGRAPVKLIALAKASDSRLETQTSRSVTRRAKREGRRAKPTGSGLA